MSNLLFSIAIPTYNRAEYLDRCLGSVCRQVNNDNCLLVEIIVSDNASTDTTKEIVDKYVREGYAIIYFRNSENKGADYNVAQCYQKANGKYILTLGDDDVLVKGALDTILNIIKNKDLGVVYMNHFSILDTFEEKPVMVDKPVVIYYDEKKRFIKKVNYYTTFISGNIINRKALSGIDLARGIGTSLPQVPLILNAIKLFDANAVVDTSLLGMQTGNTGGYSLFKTFGVNYMAMLKESFDQPSQKQYTHIIANSMLLTFFPFWIYRFKSRHTFNKEEDISTLMTPLFKQYFRYWLFNYPLINANFFFARLYYKLIKGYLLVRRLLGIK